MMRYFLANILGAVSLNEFSMGVKNFYRYRIGRGGDKQLFAFESNACDFTVRTFELKCFHCVLGFDVIILGLKFFQNLLKSLRQKKQKFLSKWM